MGAHRIRGSALTLAVLATAIGCQPQHKGPTTREANLSPPPTTAPSADPNEGSAEALARKAEEWAKLMESIRAHKNAPATAPSAPTTIAATQPTAAPDTSPLNTQHSALSTQPSSPAGTTPALVFTPPPPPPPSSRSVPLSPPPGPPPRRAPSNPKSSLRMNSPNR